MSTRVALSPAPSVERRILSLRGQRVMLDADLASLYGVSTRALNQAVKRNRERFPEDFMFRLTETEKAEVITNCDHLYRARGHHGSNGVEQPQPTGPLPLSEGGGRGRGCENFQSK